MSEKRSESGPLRDYLRFAVLILASGAALGALGFLPTRMLGGEVAVEAMLTAIAIVALGSLIGGLPVLFARLRDSPSPTIVLVSMMLRLLAVVVLATVLALLEGGASQPFLVWLALAYVALLVIDTRYSLSLLRSL